MQADFGQDPANYLNGKAGYALVDWAPTQINRYKFQPIYLGGQPRHGKTARRLKFPLRKPSNRSASSPSRIRSQHHARFARHADAGNPTQVSDFNYDDTTQTYRFKYVDNGKPREVVVKTARTLAHQLELLLPRHMRGAVITGLAGDVEPASLAQALKGYRQQAVPQGLPTSA